MGVQVEQLLSMLMETEAQMNEGMAVMDKRERAVEDSNCEQLTQQLSLCKVSVSKPFCSAMVPNVVCYSRTILVIYLCYLYFLFRISSLL